jgi:hypothetical protein
LSANGRLLTSAVIFAGLTGVWVYLFARGDFLLGDPLSFLLIPIFFAAGVFARHRGALLLALVPPLLALPAGTAPSGDSPLALVLVLVVPIGLLFIGLGLAAGRRLKERRDANAAGAQ